MAGRRSFGIIQLSDRDGGTQGRDSISCLTGIKFDRVEVYKSEQFEEFYPEEKLPAFAWVKVDGKAGEDDFGMARNFRLIVSERALKLIQSFGLAHAEISDFEE